jgi:tetratricopeptide (TPR) repeat protein
MMNKINQAIKQVENGDIENGLKQLEKMIPSSTDDEKYSIAQYYVKWGFHEKAKEIFEQLINKYPDESDLILQLAEIYIDLDQDEDAIALLDKIKDDDPSYIQALLIQADLYQVQGLEEVSEMKLLEAKRMKPDEPVIDFGLAELYFSLGEYSKCLPYYENVADSGIEISGVDLNERMAESLRSLGEFEKALPYYEKAIDERFDINTLFGYAFTAFHAGYYKKAIELFTQLKELDPDYHSLYLYLAKAYEHEGLLNDSYEHAKLGLKIDPFNKDLLLYAGKIALKLGEREEAEQHLKKAISIDPGFSEAVLSLTKIYLHDGRYEEVVECIEEVMNSGEYDPQFEWDLAYAKNKLEQYTDALKHYRQAYTFFKDNIDFLEEFGFFLLEEGAHEEAKEIFRKILEQDPANVEIQEMVMKLEDYE